MEFFEIVILILYIFALSFILLFCLTQFSLALLYLLKKRKAQKTIEQIAPADKAFTFPYVTVQLPVYNEMYVVKRLIDAVAGFDYPKEHFEIQVLDDSTDDTIAISAEKVQEYKTKGYNIFHIRRKKRTGFKAGALQEGLKTAKGEFIAIFDADFVPDPDFLLKTLPQFQNPEVGLVQTKWTHLNKNYSLLTRVQAFALDSHFNIEHYGRKAAGAFMNFNGTAGVWRKTCIEDAGGWSYDTLTEDLDLSYRAQLKGWDFIYLNDVNAPAELPALMSAIKSQQYRWSKGPAEVTKKLLGQVLSSKISLKAKWFSFFHLLNSSINIFVITAAVLTVPLLFIKTSFSVHWVFYLLYFFYTGLFAVAIFYLVGQIMEEKEIKKGTKNFLLMFPTFLALSMGLSLHNGLAAIKGLLGSKTAFIRTPKFNITTGKDQWLKKHYLKPKVDFLTILEICMAVYFLFGMFISFRSEQYELLIFHFLLFAGFLSISYFSIKHALLSVFKSKV